MRILHVLIALAALSCQPLYEAKRPYAVYGQPESFFSSAISTKESQITLANDDYPIYLELRQDKTFFYNLPRLGQGEGNWSYNATDGNLSLFAARTLFVMEFDIRSMDLSNDKSLALEFSDRFGPKFLTLEFRNGAR